MPGEKANIFNEDMARRLWKEHRKRVTNADPGETVDFRDTVFSEDPEGKYFHGIEFPSVVDFTGSTFENGKVFYKAVFNQAVLFNNVTFKVKSSFLDITFKDMVSFYAAIFNEPVVFHVDFQESASFEWAIFKSEAMFNPPNDPLLKDLRRFKYNSSVSFDNTGFWDRVSFEKLDFDGIVSFKSTKFCYWTEFNDLEFNSQVSLEDVKFLRCTDSRDNRRNLVSFQNIKYNDKVFFNQCHFECKSSFQNISFGVDTDFRGSHFGDQAIFENCKIKSRIFLDDKYAKMFYNCEDAIIPYRLAKQAASYLGDSRWTGNYHFQEQCATNAKKRRDSTLKFWKRSFWYLNTNAIWNYGELLLGRVVFGFGEKPLRPLTIGLGIIFICGILFWMTKGIDPNPPYSFLSAIYFSVVTFTTLGYGDLQPIPSMRWLSAIEAFLGAALMAMFIVALARKFTR